MGIQEVALILTALGISIAVSTNLFIYIDRKLDELGKRFDEKLEGVRKDIDGKLQEMRRDINRELRGFATTILLLFKSLVDKKIVGVNEILNVFGSSYIGRYIASPNPGGEKRKFELLKKAQRERLTYEEIVELMKLLEEQRKKHEESGDILGAVLAASLITVLSWAKEEREKEAKVVATQRS